MSETSVPPKSLELQALVYVTLVLGYAAFQAYEKAGRRKSMSEVVELGGDLEQLLSWEATLDHEFRLARLCALLP